MHLARFFGAAQFFQKREARPWTKGLVATLDRLTKDALVLHQFAAHSPPLRPLATHDKANAGRRFLTRGESRAGFRAVLVFRKPVKFLGEFPPIANDQSQTMRMMVPPRSEGVS